jgi:hypothetical protein
LAILLHILMCRGVHLPPQCTQRCATYNRDFGGTIQPSGHHRSLSPHVALQTYEWYVANYPDGPRKILGFLDYHALFALQLDHIYTSTYFLGVTTLLAASLVACSKTQQLPMVKMARRWRFAKTPNRVFTKGNGVAQRGTTAKLTS